MLELDRDGSSHASMNGASGFAAIGPRLVDDPLESTFPHSLIPAPKRANGDIGSLAVGKESLLRSDVLHVRFALPSGPFERRPTQVRYCPSSPLRRLFKFDRMN